MVFIRADSNPTISGGHIMRCLTIAKAIIKAGEKVCFLIADKNSVPVLEEAGISYIILQSDWQNLMTDVDQVQRILENERIPILLIDTYSITEEYVKALLPYSKVAYLGSKNTFLGNLDLLINYSTDIDYEFYRKTYRNNTKLLLGPSYAPLREEFQHVCPEYNKNIKSILLTTGNTDKEKIVPDLLKALIPMLLEKHIVIDVVVGRMFDDNELLHDLFNSVDCICLHENVKTMSELMRKCDLAISANGTTVYELAAMGCPIITFAMVKEQVKSAEALARIGVIDYCGKSFEDKQCCIAAIKERVNYYISHHEDLITLAKGAHKLIDGNGCQKILDALLSVQE